MTVRSIFALFVALSVLFAPAVGSAAMAAAHTDMQMTGAGHCQSLPSPSGDHGKMGAKSCCIAMCLAVAIQPSAPVDVRTPGPQQLAQFPNPTVFNGNLHEIATPPPRIN